MKKQNRFKSSIKWRFTGIFMGLIAVLLIAILMANSFFLEGYYTMQKVSTLENAYSTLDAMLGNSTDTDDRVDQLFPSNYDTSNPQTETPATTYLKSLSETSNVSVIIIDTQTDRVFSTFGDLNRQSQKLNRYIFGNRFGEKGKILASFDNYIIERNRDQNSGNLYIESWGYFSDNTTTFIMSMPISSLRESVSFFNRFLLIIGICAMVIGSIIVYFMSREISKPINEIASLSEKMSRLDFTTRYTGCRCDEIGVLGNSRMFRTKRRLRRASRSLSPMSPTS